MRDDEVPLALSEYAKEHAVTSAIEHLNSIRDIEEADSADNALCKLLIQLGHREVVRSYRRAKERTGFFTQ